MIYLYLKMIFDAAHKIKRTAKERGYQWRENPRKT